MQGARSIPPVVYGREGFVWQTRAVEVRAALDELGPLEASEAALARDLELAAGTGRDEADTEGLVTPSQAVRAIEALRGLDADHRQAVTSLLEMARSPAERAILMKGLAARKARTDADWLVELIALAGNIRGRSLEWLIAKTTLYGLEGDPGWQQHWAASCGPAVQLVARAENDPWWALKLEEALRTPSAVAEIERDILESAGGDALEVRGTKEPGDRGSWLLDYADRAIVGSGMQYELVTPRTDLIPTQKQPRSSADQLLDEAIDEMEATVRRGDDVPLGLTWQEDGDGDESGHYVLVVDVRQQGYERRWRIHDPWTGMTRWHGDRWLRRGIERVHALDEIFLPVEPRSAIDGM